jgi:hypothetical protein
VGLFRSVSSSLRWRRRRKMSTEVKIYRLLTPEVLQIVLERSDHRPWKRLFIDLQEATELRDKLTELLKQTAGEKTDNTRRSLNGRLLRRILRRGRMLTLIAS